ncbi:hypothetical protein [Miniphocaeibacter massiliensis]|uniref:hypothetical protein n=1 Tax=Miniphocaeibacter massiliensis TaxID=2041841 RepID=UPI000C1C69EA|nr:hypothetical protein [Miniphocaeibacter massiliensis]
MEKYEYIKEIEFFKKYGEGINVSEISKDIFVIESGDKKFSLRTFPIDKYGSVLDKKNKIDTLIKSGRKLYSILDAGKICNLGICYRITDYITEVKRSDIDKDNYELGYYIGETIKKYHELSHKVTDLKWEKSYNHKINYIFHEYGLCEYIGDKDYILMDYVKENKYLIFDRDTIEIFSFNNIRDIPVDDDGKIYLFGIQDIFIADPYFEFKDININYYKDEAYSAGLIDGYFGGKPSRLFFKTLALYTIIETLGKEFKFCKEINNDVVMLKTEELSSYYNDFNNIYPNWYVEIKEKLKKE